MKDFFQLREKAVSQAQQKMMGMALAYKRGEMDDASPEVKKMADSMSMKDLEDFAKTKHKDIPKKVEESTLVSEKVSDDDWVHINRVGSFHNPKKDTIVGYSKAGSDPNRAPKLKSGANAAMRVNAAKERGYSIKESVALDEEFSDKEIKMAIGVASDKRYAGGNMTGAVSAIEKIKKGLSRHPQVKAVLQRQNESVDLEEGAVAASTVEKDIRKNGGTNIKKDDKFIKFMYRGSERKVPLDKGFVKSDQYMKLQDMLESVNESTEIQEKSGRHYVIAVNRARGIRSPLKSDGKIKLFKTEDEAREHARKLTKDVNNPMLQYGYGGIWESVEDEMPASPDEKSMAIKQAEFIQYVGKEIVEHLVANKEFPEWMQNKLSALHQKAKDMHSTLGAHGMDESVQLDEGSKAYKSLEEWALKVLELGEPTYRKSGNKITVNLGRNSLATWELNKNRGAIGHSSLKDYTQTYKSLEEWALKVIELSDIVMFKSAATLSVTFDRNQSATWELKKNRGSISHPSIKESVGLDEAKESGMDVVRRIVKNKGHEKGVDMQTANMILQIYGKVSDDNKKKMDNSDLNKLVGLAQRMMKREQSGDDKSKKTEMVHKDDIRPGDTIMHKGKEVTVGSKDIKKDALMGRTIFGDSFKSGRTKVERVLFKKFRDGKMVGYVAQP